MVREAQRAASSELDNDYFDARSLTVIAVFACSSRFETTLDRHVKKKS
jgi:hypothetical protein